jgi:hypothetical protein
LEHFKKTKYFKYLLQNHNEIDKERLDFNNTIIELLNRKTDELGTILKCHLIIEFYIDNYLRVANPAIVKWKDSRLSFSQKLELIHNDKTPIGVYYPAIKCFNSIRNKFSHKISYVIQEDDYREIEKIMFIWYKASGKPLLSGIKLIEDFTVWVCANINMMISGIDKHSKILGLSGYLEWLKEMQNEEI